LLQPESYCETYNYSLFQGGLKDEHQSGERLGSGESLSLLAHEITLKSEHAKQ
jgi:hypothetical protein